MAMDLRDPNVWVSHLLENLPEEKLASALKDDNPNWEYIDGEIVKLGSLAHSQLDIPELQRRGLVILASESKDFRLLAHLLRTLQHAGDPHLALRLLALYVEHYWAVAAPQNMAHKKRFASQVIKRFETGIEVFHRTPPQRSAMRCQGNWQNWRNAGSHITPRNWHRLLMIFLPCTSVRLIVRHRLLSPLRRPPVVHHRPPPRLKAA